MGNATSSALRADDPVTSANAPGADGPAFGSLSTLGGPRKFKKKPVLVLDPEELAKAHMMFQDASAELLGEDVERPERSAPVLGLAPMDLDEPENLIASDDGEAFEEDDLPSAEDVLRMTASRQVPEERDEDEEAAIAAHLEGLDVGRRIFPTLPLKSDEQIAAEEEAERLAAEKMPPLSDGNSDYEPLHDQALDDQALEEEALAYAALDDEAVDYDMPADTDAEHPVDDVEAPGPVPASEGDVPAPRIELPHEFPADSQYIYIPPFDAIRGLSPVEDTISERAAPSSGATFPVNPLPEPEAEVLAPLPIEDEAEPVDPEPTWAEDEPAPEPEQAGEPLASARAIFGDAPFLDFPSQPITWTPVREIAAEEETAGHEPAANLPHAPTDAITELAEEDTFDEDEVEYSSNRFEWAYEDDEDLRNHEPGDAQEALHEFEAELAPEAEQETVGSYTEVEDDQVDGYAFMYAHNPRGRTIHALAEGESNSLRAKLIKEREDALAEEDAGHDDTSLWTRFTGWLRGLLS